MLDGVNGFLTTPWSVSDLYEKMAFFMENRHLIISMGVESREVALRDFDINAINENIYGFLRWSEVYMVFNIPRCIHGW